MMMKLIQPVAPARESLSEHLINQLRLHDLRKRCIYSGEEIIGNLDEDGYLKRRSEGYSRRT
jgi:DNA-directed RNA polymerase specialized sigma54-like protein